MTLSLAGAQQQQPAEPSMCATFVRQTSRCCPFSRTHRDGRLCIAAHEPPSPVVPPSDRVTTDPQAATCAVVSGTRAPLLSLCHAQQLTTPNDDLHHLATIPMMERRRVPPHNTQPQPPLSLVTASTTTTPTTPALLPGVHSFLIKSEPQPSLPSLPSLFGSFSNQSQLHERCVTPSLTHPQYQFAPVDNYRNASQHVEQQQQLLPQQVSISSLLNPTTQDVRRALAVAPPPLSMSNAAPPAAAAATLASMRPSVAATATGNSPVSHRNSDSAGRTHAQQPPQPKKKRKARICKTDGCEKYVVDRGLCIRHGGGKRCSVADCNCRAQNRGLCWKHGGYTRCTIDGCTKRAKSRGICWSHGGGTRCKHSGCAKIAVSHGLCWAHGGGKRCLVDGCQKPAYERNGNLCADHCGASSSSIVVGEHSLSE